MFTKRETVISSFVVGWIVGYGSKTPDDAKKYIKTGETLNPNYYSSNQKESSDKGEEFVYSKFMKLLFNRDNIDHELSQIVGKKVYKPWDCLSGIYQIELSDRMGIVARPNGVTKNNRYIIMVDDYLTHFNRQDTEDEIKTKLMATMAVWKAKKGLYFIRKMNKVIRLDFDIVEWESILSKLKEWAKIL